MYACRTFPPDVKNQEIPTEDSRHTSETEIEILKEGIECPNCHFATLKREGSEIVYSICGYGYKPCT